MTLARSAVATLLLLSLTSPAPLRGQEPAFGLPVSPLGPGPFVFDTAEQPRIRVNVLTRGLVHPWAIAFLPDGAMLVTERPGRLRVIRDGVLEPQPITGVPQVRTDGNGGLMEVALHPRFGENRLVYLTYTKPVGGGRGAPALARGRLEGRTLVDVRDLLVTEAFDGNSGLNGRVVFGRDGMAYMSTGGNVAKVSQDPASLRANAGRHGVAARVLDPVNRGRRDGRLHR
jgi:glucose/arabinose dehydrogenase